MKCSGICLALADLRSVGDLMGASAVVSTGGSASGSTGSTVVDSSVLTLGDSSVEDVQVCCKATF